MPAACANCWASFLSLPPPPPSHRADSTVSDPIHPLESLEPPTCAWQDATPLFGGPTRERLRTLRDGLGSTRLADGAAHPVRLHPMPPFGSAGLQTGTPISTSVRCSPLVGLYARIVDCSLLSHGSLACVFPCSDTRFPFPRFLSTHLFPSPSFHLVLVCPCLPRRVIYCLCLRLFPQLCIRLPFDCLC